MDKRYSTVLVAPEKSKKLVNLLKQGNIEADEVNSVALALASYHKNVDIVRNAFDINGFQDKFREIERCRQFIEELMDATYSEIIEQSIELSNRFLNSLRLIIQERTIKGNMRNGHGNLSASWIFLDDEILIKQFEDNDERKIQVDVLNDLARLGVDFDYYGQEDKGWLLFKTYMKNFGDEDNKNTRALYNYYKSFHINKILIGLVDKTTVFHFSEDRKSLIRKYLKLYKEYFQQTENYLKY
ncbi:MAG: hypothetical protein ACP5E3_17505 [Bacteroidales bacterium]